MPDSDNHYGTAVRSDADGADARIQVKVVDKAQPSTQQMTVDTDSNAHVEIHGNKPDGTDVVERFSEQGSPSPDGIYNATTNSVPASEQVVVSVRGSTVDKTSQTLRQTGVRNGTVNAADVSIYDENGVPYTKANPFPVAIEPEEAGIGVHQQMSTASPIAVGTPQTVSTAALTAAATLKQIVLSASSKTKFQVYRGMTGTPVLMYVGFNSEDEPNWIIPVPSNCTLAIGEVLSVTFTSEMPTGTTAYTGYVTFEYEQ